ncbi:hypothetical protein scyTo_0017563 [Scyliorhinus torazame]|uniref:Uncharacterized protein n=1 Tax=Scyliorhinus torazame TaxID=75743 RepID=A0A401PVN5_SCYTO|nr:hypothetical protein [Scyliorhinus torazame]
MKRGSLLHLGEDSRLAQNGITAQKEHFGLLHVKQGGDAASTQQAAAGEFPKMLQEHMEERGHQAEQIFSADKTSLLWKKVPNGTPKKKGRHLILKLQKTN